MVDYQSHRSYLVVGECNINCIIVLFVVVAIEDLVPVENRELFAKVFRILSAQKLFHRTAVKREDGNHVSSVQFQIGLVENLWIPLHGHNIFDVSHVVATIHTFKQKKLS